MKTLAKYTWSKEGQHNFYNVALYSDSFGDCQVYGEMSVPSTVAAAIKFMYTTSTNKLVIDGELTIVEVE